MKESDNSLMNLFLLMMILINILNYLDIYTTRIFTKDFTDMRAETNDWLVYNVQGGYLREFNNMKLQYYFLGTSGLYFAAYIFRAKKYAQSIFLIIFGWFLSYMGGVVISNAYYIVRHMGWEALLH